MNTYRIEEIEKAKIAKHYFDAGSWICFNNSELYSEAYRRLENYGLVTLVKGEARLGILGIDELNKFIDTGKTKYERENIEKQKEKDKEIKKEKVKELREWITLVIAIWAFIRTFQ